MGTLDSIHGPVDGIPARESARDHTEKVFSRGPILTAPRRDLQAETHCGPRANTRPLMSGSKHAIRKKRRVGGVGAIVARVVSDCQRPLGAQPQAPSFPPTKLPRSHEFTRFSPHGRGSAKATREPREGRQRHPCLCGGGRDRQRDNLPPHGARRFSAAWDGKYSFRCSLPKQVFVVVIHISGTALTPSRTVVIYSCRYREKRPMSPVLAEIVAVICL